MSPMYVYAISPIDFWIGWMTQDEFIVSYNKNVDDLDGKEHAAALVSRAQQIATQVGWEGDVREGVYFSALPGQSGDCSSETIVAWKQDNNGLTFIATPYRLPWLDKDEQPAVG